MRHDLRASLHMTFQLPGGVSPQAEKMLWRAGILTWNDYRRWGEPFFSATRHTRLLSAIQHTEELLEHAPSSQALLQIVTPAWTVRLFPLLRDDTLYLDIETTGLARDDTITVVTLYHRSEIHFFVKDKNLHMLPQFIPPSAVLVTFHGRRFDLPRLRRHFQLPIKYPHVDLGSLATQLGYPSRLLACLERTGVVWPADLPREGSAAPELWQRYMAGDMEALRTLLTYNAFHAVLLEHLWTFMYNHSLQAWPLFRPLKWKWPCNVREAIASYLH